MDEVPKIHKPNPCRYCVAPKRHPGCHEHCKARKEWKEETDLAKAEIRKEYLKDIDVRSYMIEGIRKNVKKRRS